MSKKLLKMNKKQEKLAQKREHKKRTDTDDKEIGNTEDVPKKKKPKYKKKIRKDTAGTEKVVKKVKQRLLGDLPESTSELTPEDMLTWAEFNLQEPIIKALTELGFRQPTKIQELTLPAAIHGRRDILGAAETGSGKTLAFGLPILCGILKLKEKVELKDVYEILEEYDVPVRKRDNYIHLSDLLDSDNLADNSDDEGADDEEESEVDDDEDEDEESGDELGADDDDDVESGDDEINGDGSGDDEDLEEEENYDGDEVNEDEQ
ncbi:ATP-dependent RNA helicase ddx24-like, partial [Spodoptera litura]|uniref:RNA helicase n=1 Tax=Spodoptera litura TaxID=69820 RepID=A0A9J7ES95_SPOLT